MWRYVCLWFRFGVFGVIFVGCTVLMLFYFQLVVEPGAVNVHYFVIKLLSAFYQFSFIQHIFATPSSHQDLFIFGCRTTPQHQPVVTTHVCLTSNKQFACRNECVCVCVAACFFFLYFLSQYTHFLSVSSHQKISKPEIILKYHGQQKE